MVVSIVKNIFEFFKNSMLGYWYAFKYASIATYKLAEGILFALYIIFYPLIWLHKKINNVIPIGDLIIAFIVLCLEIAFYVIKAALVSALVIMKWVFIIMFYMIIGFLLAPFFLLFLL